MTLKSETTLSGPVHSLTSPIPKTRLYFSAGPVLTDRTRKGETGATVLCPCGEIRGEIRILEYCQGSRLLNRVSHRMPRLLYKAGLLLFVQHIFYLHLNPSTHTYLRRTVVSLSLLYICGDSKDFVRSISTIEDQVKR